MAVLRRKTTELGRLGARGIRSSRTGSSTRSTRSLESRGDMDMNEANEGRGVRGEYEEEYEAPFAIAVRYLSVPRRPSNGGTNRRVQSPTGRGGFQSPIRTPPNRPTGRGDGRGPDGPPTPTDIVYLNLSSSLDTPDTSLDTPDTSSLPGEFEKIYRIFPFTNPGVKRPRI